MKTAVLIIASIFVSVSLQAQMIKAPQNFTATWEADSGWVSLSWDEVEGDNAGYHLFVQRPNQDKLFLESSAGQIPVNKYYFKVAKRAGGVYQFSVAAFQNFPKLVYGMKSDTVKLSIPTGFLPMVKDVSTKISSGSIDITWSYPFKVFDLKGFEVELNDSTFFVNKENLSARLREIEPGAYRVSITAISQSGIKSDASATKIVRVKR